MRVKTDYRSASKSSYENFCLSNPNIRISYNEWLEIIYMYNEGFRDTILETGEKERLPSGLGAFSINKKKRVTKVTTPEGKQFINLPVDWKRTKEKGKIIYNFNFHTEGFFFGWMWFKKEARFQHSALWRFKPSRVSSRMINHYIKSNAAYQHRYKQWKH